MKLNDEIEDDGNILGYLAEELAHHFHPYSPGTTVNPTPKHYQVARILLQKFDIKIKLTVMSHFQKGDIVIDNCGTMWIRQFKDPVHHPERDEWGLIWVGPDEYDVEENTTVSDHWLSHRKLKLLVRDGAEWNGGV